MWQKMLQVGSGGGTPTRKGFFEDIITITADNVLVGQPYSIALYNSDESSSIEVQNGTLKATQDVSVSSLGSYKVLKSDGTPFSNGEFTVDDFDITLPPINLVNVRKRIVTSISPSSWNQQTRYADIPSDALSVDISTFKCIGAVYSGTDYLERAIIIDVVLDWDNRRISYKHQNGPGVTSSSGWTITVEFEITY